MARPESVTFQVPLYHMTSIYCTCCSRKIWLFANYYEFSLLVLGECLGSSYVYPIWQMNFSFKTLPFFKHSSLGTSLPFNIPTSQPRRISLYILWKLKLEKSKYCSVSWLFDHVDLKRSIIPIHVRWIIIQVNYLPKLSKQQILEMRI